MCVCAVSYTHLDVYKRQMQYLGLTGFNERDNGFVNDRQVDIAVMGISLRTVMSCSTLVGQLTMNVSKLSLTIGMLILRLWLYRYERLPHAVTWSGGFQ